VIPLFKQQISAGGPVTVTLAEMTRFLMTLDQAVDTVFAAILDAAPGEIFIPQVSSARVVDVASVMIGEQSIETLITGIRPGEKIHEILLSEEESFRTSERNDYYVLQPQLPELADDDIVRALHSEYSSQDSLVTGADLERLVALADFTDSAMSGPGAPASGA